MATLFGTLPDGREVYSFTLRNKNGMTVSAINYGGIITSICVPDKSGKIEDVVLGYDSLDAVELIMAVEKKYNISITDEELEKVFTFKDLVKNVKEKLKNEIKN